MGEYLRFDESIDVDKLAHYGVLGMHWGVRNAETEARYARGRRLSKNQKTALKVAAGVAAVGAAAALTYAGIRSGAIAEGAKVAQMAMSETPAAKSALFSKTTVIRENLGRSANGIDRKMIASVNSENNISSASGNMNCFHTSAAYILNSLYGGSVKANPMTGIDEASGLQLLGRDPNLWHATFSGLKETTVKADGVAKLRDLDQAVAPGSTGVIFMGNHFFNYEKTSAGALTFIDAQPSGGSVMAFANAKSLDLPIMSPHDVRIFDFSEAKIADPMLLKYFVH